MIDLDLEKRVRAAARAAADAVNVPQHPASLLLLRPGAAQYRTRRWFWAAAAAAMLALTVATDGGRAAIAYAVEHVVKVFSVDPDTGKRVPISTITMQEALSTPEFPVVVPRGLPSDARLLSIQRMGDPETGRPSVVFHYALGAKPFDILESGVPVRVAAANQLVRPSSSTMPEPRGVNTKVVTSTVTFRAGDTQVTVSVASGALDDRQIAAIRTATTALPIQKER